MKLYPDNNGSRHLLDSYRLKLYYYHYLQSFRKTDSRIFGESIKLLLKETDDELASLEKELFIH